MSTHDVPRTSGHRTEEQQRQELEKIKKYRELEEQFYSQTSSSSFEYTPALFQLTIKLLKLNPEYFTVWNVRRHLLISSLSPKSSSGPSRSTGCSSSSSSGTTTALSGASSQSRSAETLPSPESRTAGRDGQNGTTREGEGSKSKEADKKNAAAAENDANAIQSELAFIFPLLKDYPKCYWIWNYRRWILELAIKYLPVTTARRVWEEELGLDSMMLTRDRRNYHAWAYRRYLVAKLESTELGGKSMVEEEFGYTTRMTSADLSNFSAWHNRSKLIPRLLDERGASDFERRAFFDEELGRVKEALNVGPEDQSLWFYHQYLMSSITDYVGRATIVPNLDLEERVTYVTTEIEEIEELLEDFKDVKWIYEALLEYTLSLQQLEERELDAAEKERLGLWLGKLRELDPLRNGRWDDVEVDCKL
ncbi:Protein prenylyltransferase [Coniochaeta hoffmannii]|uniref:Geranylgeranyl transferase type-2 subunit alpha n=1 Tax=Coniochaeta hoffmannii TaxID=91930 RepID=A0AA38SA83_9PEZI|nr:Protein prenylyltransferase [Coniochaeta hoffmannii]